MKALSLGSTARQIIARRPQAHLLGVTSKGVFASTISGEVLFLSGERYRGPLTLNLEGPLPRLRETPGDPLVINADGLWFAKSELWVSVLGAEEWRPPPPGEPVLAPAERLARLAEVAGHIQARAAATGETLSGLSRALHNQDARAAAACLRPILGCGSGLTPAGDDLALGLLLALNRWGSVLAPGFVVEALNAQVTEDARERTTSLSACLIACAAQGLADERLVAGLDGLVTGSPDAATCAACFNDWGSTSGGSALMGMRLAMAGVGTDSG